MNKQASKVKQIYVRGGYGWEEPVTVQVLETVDEHEKEVAWCNHANAELEESENCIYNPEGRDIVWVNRAYVCKCGAYRREGEADWEDAPFSGVHYE